jgi:hypothetical protein
MAPHHFDQFLHLPQHPLAPLATVCAPALVRHLHAQAIDPSQKLLGRFHPALESLLADEQGGFHQGAHPVAQQHPIHWKMDVGLQRGRIQKIVCQVQRLPQAQLAGLIQGAAQKTVDDLPHLLSRQPVGIALQLALGRHLNLIQGIDQTKPLIEGIARQLATETSIVLLQEGAQNIAAQGAAAALLKPLLLPGRGGPAGRFKPALQGPFDKLPFQSAAAQKRVDLFQALAQSQVIDIAHDGGQAGPQFGGKGNDQT